MDTVSINNPPLRPLDWLLAGAKRPQRRIPVPAAPKFRLKSLDEHRFATRFEPAKVTPQTWPKALRAARRKLRGGDRIQQVEALYVLLEVADLRPRGCDLARVWLNAGSIYLLFHHLDEAVHAYRQCLHIDPTSWKARFNVGVALARQRVFAVARSELELALACAHCPHDAVNQIHELLRAIDTIQSRRNEQAFRATNEARAFTWRYLETLHLLTMSRDPSIQANAVPAATAIARLPPPPNAPLLFELATGWNGPIAALLHELHVYASLHSVSLDDEYVRLDPARTGVISLSSFESLYRRICGIDLSPKAAAALGSIFPNNAIMLRLLVPNPETLQVIDEMKRVGFFYAGMSWRLTKRRLKRSASSRNDGLWKWMDLSLGTWSRDVAARKHLSPNTASRLPGLLLMLDLTTPMHFGSRLLPSSNDLGRLVSSDWELVLGEIGSAASEIRDECCRVLQMFFRRLRVSKRKERGAVNRKFGRPRKPDAGVSIAYVPVVTIREQREITRSVMETLDDLVEAVVASARAERYSKTILPLGDSPVRTENRHRLD